MISTRSTIPVATFALGLTAVFLVAGCGSRKNDALGLDYIEDQAQTKAVRTITITPPDSSSDFQLSAPEGTSGLTTTLLLGQETGLSSRGLVRFDLAALPDSGQSASLIAATARFFFHEGTGDPATLALAVHRCVSNWEESIASADSLFPAIDPVGFTTSLAVADSGDSADISVTELVRFWIDRPDSNFGIALLPEAGVNGLQEFYSAEGLLPPQLLARWSTASGESTAAINPNHDTFFLRTTTGFVPLSDTPGRLAVGRGIAARSFVKFPFPDLGPRATIHRAELTLFADQSVSRLHEFTIGVQRLLDANWNGASTSLDGTIESAVSVSAQSDSVTILVTTAVNEMLDEGNFGFLVRANDEKPDVDFIRFHAGDSEDSARRPRLKIWTTAGDAP